MPKTPARDDYLTQSFRFTPEQAATIKEEAKRCARLYAPKGASVWYQLC